MSVDNNKHDFPSALFNSSLFNQVLERLIPAEDGFPSAGDLKLEEHIKFMGARHPYLNEVFADGFAIINETSNEALGADFVSLATNNKDDVLKLVEKRAPEFFQELLRHTYTGYYINSTVVRLLKIQGRPPQPEGYDLPPFDLKLLDSVKKRSPFYRKV
ncbi:MAG: Gluconate 2-dehydrogenase subunit 3 [Chloroflexi bacterium]|jgi:hypothetical protein|nr:MAG: Gluconate 2-dehydrogenase subunit 3 [Chloroflexota bacterium]